MICFQLSPALCADFTGNWSGTWIDYKGKLAPLYCRNTQDCGNLSGNLTQDVHGNLSGTITVENTSCGTITFPLAPGSYVSGDVAYFQGYYSCNCSNCDSLAFTSGTLINGNTMNGSWILNVNYVWNNTGDFSLTRPDTTSPPAPVNLTATPSTWTNNNLFTINWTNPSDPSGIAGAYHKLGSAPTSNTDGTYTTSKPFTVAATAQGGQAIYVWLKDGAGNTDHNNWSSTTLYYVSVVFYISKDGVCSGKTPCYTTIQNGIIAATAPTAIKITRDIYDENIILNSNQVIFLQGGWDTNFTSNSSFTTINGSLTITNGTMTLENIILK
jgi:hypothetical protein